MYANSKKITAVLFLDYQYSMTVQIRCELTKLIQQQIFQITITINRSVLSVSRPLLLSSKYVFNK